MMIKTHKIGTDTANNPIAKQTLTPIIERGIKSPHKRHGRQGKLQQFKIRQAKMQSPVQSSNPIQTIEAIPPRPSIETSKNPASKMQPAEQHKIKEQAVMHEQNKNKIRIKRKSKAGNMQHKSKNAVNPTMLYHVLYPEEEYMFGKTIMIFYVC